MKKTYSSADILLPDFGSVDANKWAVIACDQFTSEEHYWQEVEATVGQAPSTLRLILPEVYLKENESRIEKINLDMDNYLKKILFSHHDSMIYTERTQSDGKIRKGIVLAVDLECYDFHRGASSLIRATEATVIERIPPRVAIRRDAKIELPHIMLLIDDPECTVIEPLFECEHASLAYDTPLMLGGGHIKGYFLSDAEKQAVSNALDALITPEAMEARYGDRELAPLLFAVGDGNHSLATAKTIYEELKAELGEKAAAEHPARYALVEIVNIHDGAMKFEPIYRVMFGIDPEDVKQALAIYLAKLNGGFDPQSIEYHTFSGSGVLCAQCPEKTLTVATLQDFIDEYIKTHPLAEVDYIHGEDSVKSLIRRDSIGFLFSGMSKSELFKTVIYDGALPRKTFSMGHARDKRYYLECRKITK